jgi:hypothetical protein
MNIKIPITFYFVLHLIATLIGVQSHITINEIQTKMHYYSEANYPSPITSYKFAINTSFKVEIATEILYIIKHVLRRRLKPDLLVLLYFCAILLANSYAPEPNPGHRTLRCPCGSCNKAVTWKTAGVCCDSCDTWHHKDCIGMSTMIYKGLHNVSWNCDLCGLPNFSSCIFDTSTFVSTNIYDTLNDSSFNENSIGSSTVASSPVHKQKSPRNYTANKRNDAPLRVLVIHCQSIKDKKYDMKILTVNKTRYNHR